MSRSRTRQIKADPSVWMRSATFRHSRNARLTNLPFQHWRLFGFLSTCSRLKLLTHKRSTSPKSKPWPSNSRRTILERSRLTAWSSQIEWNFLRYHKGETNVYRSHSISNRKPKTEMGSQSSSSRNQRKAPALYPSQTHRYTIPVVQHNSVCAGGESGEALCRHRGRRPQCECVFRTGPAGKRCSRIRIRCAATAAFPTT